MIISWIWNGFEWMLQSNWMTFVCLNNVREILFVSIIIVLFIFQSNLKISIPDTSALCRNTLFRSMFHVKFFLIRIIIRSTCANSFKSNRLFNGSYVTQYYLHALLMFKCNFQLAFEFIRFLIATPVACAWCIVHLWIEYFNYSELQDRFKLEDIMRT